MPLASEPAEDFVGEQHALLCAHGHLATQHLFVFFIADGDDRDLAAHARGNLQRLFDSVVVPFVDRVHEVVALDIVAGAV